MQVKTEAKIKGKLTLIKPEDLEALKNKLDKSNTPYNKKAMKVK